MFAGLYGGVRGSKPPHLQPLKDVMWDFYKSDKNFWHRGTPSALHSMNRKCFKYFTNANSQNILSFLKTTFYLQGSVTEPRRGTYVPLEWSPLCENLNAPLLFSINCLVSVLLTFPRFPRGPRYLLNRHPYNTPECWCYCQADLNTTSLEDPSAFYGVTYQYVKKDCVVI